MAYAIKIDWMEELKNCDKWVNHGRNIAEDKCKHKTQDTDNKRKETNMRYSGWCEECNFSEDSCIPMMNFAYPLECNDPDEDKIKEVVDRTCCTVMENSGTGEWFLALCGGGMDLSQDIALAYHLLETWISFELAINVCTQKDLSIRGKDWDVLRKAVIDSFKSYKGNAEGKLEEWGD